MSTINFVGTLGANAEDSKVPFRRELTSKTGGKGLSINLYIQSDTNNRAFLEVVGFKSAVIKTYDTQNQPMDVDWDDRNDKAIIESVANYRKHVVVDGDERHEFISDYDFCKFLSENIDEIKGGVWQITGDVQKDFYNGTVRDRFRIRNMFRRAADAKKQFKITTVLYWNKDGIDTDEWDKTGKITINGYTEEYISKDDGRKYVPQNVVFTKTDDPDSDEFVLKQLGIALNDGEVTVKAKKNMYYVNEFDILFRNGAEEIAFNEDELTDMQKEAIKRGLKTVDDFRPRGQIYGKRTSVWKIVSPTLSKTYEDGIAACDKKVSEFEDDIYVAPSNSESLENAMNKPVEDDDEDEVVTKKSSKTKEKAEVDTDDLFD